MADAYDDDDGVVTDAECKKSADDTITMDRLQQQQQPAAATQRRSALDMLLFGEDDDDAAADKPNPTFNEPKLHKHHHHHHHHRHQTDGVVETEKKKRTRDQVDVSGDEHGGKRKKKKEKHAPSPKRSKTVVLQDTTTLDLETLARKRHDMFSEISCDEPEGVADDSAVEDDSAIEDDSAVAVGGDKDDVVTVVPPIYKEIERKLGPRVPGDDYCYICDTVMVTGAGSIPEVTKLREDMIEFVCNEHDPVAAAKKIQEQFERTIRRPANKKKSVAGREKVREWTLRGVYIHITQHMNDAAIIMNSSVVKYRYLQERMDHKKIYVVPRSKAYSQLKDDDLEPTKEGVAMLNGITQKLVSLVEKREKYRHYQSSQDASASLGGRSESAGGRTIRNMGGGGQRMSNKDGAVKASKLLGDKMDDGNSANRSEKSTWLERNARRPFG